MSRSSRHEARLLSVDEADLVARSHHPRLAEADDGGLAELVARLRESRDRARHLSRRQRRELRGKADPSGARAATDNTGTRRKAAVLAAAVKRASKESERRRNARARGRLVTSSRRALAMRQAAGDPGPARPSTREAHDGMRPVPNDGLAPSGALDSAGHEIARRRGGGPR